jgi:hypothetical protein
MSDLTLSGEELLLQLINEANPDAPYGPFTAGSFTFSAPASLTGDLTGKNSYLTLTAIPGSGYYGTQTVKYNRLDLQNILIGKGFPSVSLPNNSYSQSTDLLDALNTTFGLNLTTADIVGESLPAADTNGNVAYTVQVVNECLTFFGALPVNLTPNKINLQVAFVQNILHGFVPPDATRINLATALTGNVLDGFTVADVTAAPSPA